MRRPLGVVVCDASVAIAWLLEEVAPLWVTAFRDAVTARQTQIRVPTLFWLGIGSRLVRTRGVTDAQVLEAFVRLEALGFETMSLAALGAYLAELRQELGTTDRLQSRNSGWVHAVRPSESSTRARTYRSPSRSR